MCEDIGCLVVQVELVLEIWCYCGEDGVVFGVDIWVVFILGWDFVDSQEEDVVVGIGDIGDMWIG